VATVATATHHVLMSLLLIVRQGWLAAAGQACGFILTLNPFEVGLSAVAAAAAAGCWSG